jgi:hypothetical protein
LIFLKIMRIEEINLSKQYECYKNGGEGIQ